MSYNSKYKSSKIEEILDSVEGKQDAIADLDAIRSGAEKGATALQSIPSEYITETELNNKSYATSESLQSLALRVQDDMDIDKRELTEAINTKQNKIDDLETIRSGAALGATALQFVPSTYATKTDVDNAIANAITSTINASY